MRGVETDKRFVTERQNHGTLKALKLTVPATVKIGGFSKRLRHETARWLDDTFCSEKRRLDPAILHDVVDRMALFPRCVALDEPNSTACNWRQRDA